MPKDQPSFFCTHCGAQFPHWSGRCEECGKWNTIQKVDETVEAPAIFSAKQGSKSSPVIPSSAKVENLKYDPADLQKERIKSGIFELDKVLGGGIVAGSIILLGGEPGIGKSTLVLQAAAKLVQKNNLKVLYFSAEESREQVALRASRLKVSPVKIAFAAETNLENILALILKEKPALVIIDSIQTIASNEAGGASGSLGQVKLCADKLMVLAKSGYAKAKIHPAIILIGHVTKEGVVAGPKTLEHLVDTVLYLEGERMSELRILRTVKNRFGSTGEAGVFKMETAGFCEVKNPSAQFLSERNKNSIGSSVSAVLEGRTPFLIEVQALTQRTVFGYPERKTHGFPLSRLNILLAVISRHLKIRLLNQDVYINLAGGLKVSEPSLDLAVVLAIVSAYKNKPLPMDLVVLGEVGLSGEVRKTREVEKRLKEAERLGFKKALGDFSNLKMKTKLKVLNAQSLKEAVKFLAF